MVKALALDEQETNFTIEATDRNLLYIFSNDSVWQARIEKLGIAPYRVDGYGKFYNVNLEESFTFVLRKKRKMSDEQRQLLSERMRSFRGDGDADDSDDESDGDDSDV